MTQISMSNNDENPHVAKLRPSINPNLQNTPKMSPFSKKTIVIMRIVTVVGPQNLVIFRTASCRKIIRGEKYR